MSEPQASASPVGKRRKPARQKHVPIRTCIACRESGAKRGLTRIVRDPDGGVVIDPTGKRNGRGAYLCDKPSCWDRALQGDQLGRALNTGIDPATLAELNQFASSLRTSEDLQADAVNSKEPAP